MYVQTKKDIGYKNNSVARREALFGKDISTPFFQPKLTVNTPGDAYEQEADQVAERVMGMQPGEAAQPQALSLTPVAPVQRQCADCEGEELQRKEEETEEKEVQLMHIASNADDTIQRQCAACEQEEAQRKESGGGDASGKAAPSIVNDVLSSSGGQAMDGGTRQFMESRFGHDFGQVRIHTDSRAAESATAIQAKAYTSGRDIVFGQGQYQPESDSGKRLLAHELAHVGQQRGGSTSTNSIQRSCGPTGIGTPTGCTSAEGNVTGPRYLFKVNCDDFATGNQLDIETDAASIPNGATIELHGFASSDGDPTFNAHLSCARAIRARSVVQGVLSRRGIQATILVFNHGAVSGSPTSMRSVVMLVNSGTQPRLTPSTITHNFRGAAVSFLSCAPCNPYTDDGAHALSPPSTEPTSGFRMSHFLEGDITTDGTGAILGQHLSSGNTVGVTGYCGTHGLGHIVNYHVGSPSRLPRGTHGEGVEWRSTFETRLGATVPPTLIGAPCGYLGTNSMIPSINNTFFIRIFADGTKQSGFVGGSRFPFHYLYDDRVLKFHAGSPVSLEVDYAAWALSTGIPSLAMAEAGLKALRLACCSPAYFISCPTSCVSGFSVPNSFSPDKIISCPALSAAILSMGCPAACSPVGSSCSTLTRAANP